MSGGPAPAAGQLSSAAGGADDATITFVLVAYNSAEAFRQSLPALARELRPGDGVVVVDNASSDDSVAVVHELCPGATVIDGGGNTGFAAGANTGAAAAGGDLVVFLNPDATVQPGFGAAIRQPLVDARGWDAWMALVTAEDGAVINTSGNLVHFTGIAWAGQAGRPVAEADAAPHEVAYLSGACLVAPLDVWRRHGGFPERYFMYHEDLDFSLRVRLAGGRVGIEPSARVDHDYDFVKGPAKWRHMERNRLSMIVRLYPASLLLLVLPALVATEAALIVVAAAGGWGREKLIADVQWLRELPRLLAQRRVIQRGRRIGAAELARWLTPELSSAFLGPLARFAPLQLALRIYWAGVRALLR